MKRLNNIVLLFLTATFSYGLCSCHVDAGKIIVKDSLVFEKYSAPHMVYWYYRDNGVIGRSNDYFIALDNNSANLKTESAFFSSPGIIKIKKENDSLKIVVIRPVYKILGTSAIKFDVIVDDQTWKY